ncbi:DUF881 domain-containing protein [Streptomyces sp. BI20]|uniref:DUF881 domain-containing protein n=1 Tax=Streptomyces sp. BI20 TaxID=3403460 RepID=UPI003C721CB3
MCGMSQPSEHRDPAPSGTTGGPRSARGRLDASMSLLTDAMRDSLDAGYAEAHARRAAEGPASKGRTGLRGLALGAGALLVALVVTLGVEHARTAAPTLAKEREELIDRVRGADDHADTLDREIDELRADVDRRRSEALKAHGGDQGALTALLAGATPVTGPGIELTVDDAKGAGSGTGGPRENTGFSDSGRLRDRDMQRIVNGLWGAGAEAVAINGQRLTALSAIRAAGDAILVDNRPLVPPYEVLVIGDPKKLGTDFPDSPDGQYLHVLKESYGIQYKITARDEVTLPAASGLTVRSATAAPAAPVGKGAS